LAGIAFEFAAAAAAEGCFQLFGLSLSLCVAVHFSKLQRVLQYVGAFECATAAAAKGCLRHFGLSLPLPVLQCVSVR